MERLAFLFLIGFVATEPWRYLALLLPKNIDINGEFLTWVKAVSTALVAGLVMRLLFFPIGSLANTPLLLRVTAFMIGLIVFQSLGRRMAPGVLAGLAVLLTGDIFF